MPKDSRGSALVIIIFIVFLSAVLVGGWWLIWQSPKSKTASTQNISPQTSPPAGGQAVAAQNSSFSDADSGISFAYPVGSNVIEETEEEYFKRANGNIRKNFTGYITYAPPEVVNTFFVTNDNKLDNSPFIIWEFANPDNLTASEWYKDYWYYPFVWGEYADPGRSKYAPTVEATVAGQLAGYTTIDYRPGDPNFYLIPSGDKMFLVITQGAGSEILQTLKIN